ncbi:MAG: hypothetical protein B7C24_06500 [Bacteroidetes bacterium 4572_77]|nr:MAG: hypothetical protein B7C24_06500 [Bacteroidetes bacterium 4572_77]
MYNEDDQPAGPEQDGANGPLLFNDSPVSTTTYYIMATNDINGCSNEITEQAIVLVNSLPNNTLAVSNPSGCAGETLNIVVSNSVPSVSYQLRLHPSNIIVSDAFAGTGGNLNFPVTPGGTTTYNILATNDKGCTSELINTSTVTIFDTPYNNLIVDDDEVCYGETAHLVVYNTQTEVRYQLRLEPSNTNVGSYIDGTGEEITFDIINATATTNYNVYAYNNNACDVVLIDKPTVIVNPLPDNTLTLGNDQICAGDEAEIQLFNSVSGFTYQLRLDEGNVDLSSDQGNGGTLTFYDSPTINTTYNILAINNTTGCINEIIDKSVVQVYPAANNNLAVSNPIICLGEEAIIYIDNTQSGVMYQLRLDDFDTHVGAAVPGNNGTISVHVSPSASTMYNVLATTSNSCSVELTNRSWVTVNPTPDATLAVSNTDICQGETAEIRVYTPEIGVDYQLRLDADNTNVGAAIPGDGSPYISFFVTISSSTDYNILAIGGNACSIELTQKADVDVYPQPDASLLVDNATICAGETAVIILQNSELGVNYLLRINEGDIPLEVQSGDGGDLEFFVDPIESTIYNILATSADACSLELTDKGIVSVLPAPIINYDLSDEEICLGDVASITQSSSSLGVSYQLRDNVSNNPVGAAIMGTGFAIQYNVNPLISTTYNVLATNSNTCSGLLTDVAVVTVNALPTKPSITANGPTTFG